ncbi:hypothetical protein BJX63DRAFT_315207 [Aspergillus granulosus]|uniref:Phospholipase/carboxylesterase/thioesterase domain-containing protein n=1 Tax=Aspergillus granulosus TaxID=176169 RepID=A0ABR4H520_9EURO
MGKQEKPQRDLRRPKPLVVPPRKEHTHTAILLHDKGDKGRVFGRDFLISTGLQDHFPTLRCVFPCAFNAPAFVSSEKSAHQNGDTKRRTTPPSQWFDDPSHMRQSEVTTASLPETARFLQRVINDEAKVLMTAGKHGMHEAHKRLFVGGSGHGGAVALLYLLGSHRQLGGFIGLDAMLPWQFQLEIALEVGTSGDGDSGVVRGVNYVRELLGFERLEGNKGGCVEALQHLRTPVFFGYRESREKGRVVASLLADAFRVHITEKWCASRGTEYYSQPENLEALVEFLEEICVPGRYRASHGNIESKE